MRLADLGVRLITRVRFNQITKKGILITQDGGSEFQDADSIVLAVTTAPNQDLMQALEREGISAHAVGDCMEPRGVKEAIDEGLRVALAL